MRTCLKDNSCKAKYKIYVFIKKVFHIASLFLSSLVGATLLSCISINSQACKVRPEIGNVNSNEPVFYPFSIKTSKCSGSCSNINDPYATVCVPDVVKDLYVKVFNLMSRNNETRHMKWHKTCMCKCGLDASVCNSKQSWNSDKCRCECKELLIKVYAIKDLFVILVIVSLNVINHAILVSI